MVCIALEMGLRVLEAYWDPQVSSCGPFWTWNPSVLPLTGDCGRLNMSSLSRPAWRGQLSSSQGVPKDRVVPIATKT